MALGIEKERKSGIIRETRRHETDSGSPEVQIALLTERVRYLTEHLKQAPKDFSTRRGLLKLVGKRSALLRYLARTDAPRYQALIARLGIRR
jgi:small subunit ribosomal protein S15